MSETVEIQTCPTCGDGPVLPECPTCGITYLDWHTRNHRALKCPKCLGTDSHFKYDNGANRSCWGCNLCGHEFPGPPPSSELAALKLSSAIPENWYFEL